MALSLKRTSSSLPFPSSGPAFKRCRKNSILPANDSTRQLLLSHEDVYGISSSEDDNDDEENDEDDYFQNNSISRRRSLIRRRSSTRSAADTAMNIELSRAVALYSDDDDEDEEIKPIKVNNNKVYSESNIKSKERDASNLSSSSIRSFKSSLPDSDRAARARCLEYLIGAIDEAWARYCDATTYEEDEHYHKRAKTPSSTDNDEDSDASLAETEITDYADLDYSDSKDFNKRQEQSSLQKLKDKLMNAKYYLQDYVDSDQYEDCIAFWKRWDMVKYCTIELVEDEDEDEIVENTIDELENGRYQIVV